MILAFRKFPPYVDKAVNKSVSKRVAQGIGRRESGTKRRLRKKCRRKESDSPGAAGRAQGVSAESHGRCAHEGSGGECARATYARMQGKDGARAREEIGRGVKRAGGRRGESERGRSEREGRHDISLACADSSSFVTVAAINNFAILSLWIIRVGLSALRVRIRVASEGPLGELSGGRQGWPILAPASLRFG